MAGANAQAVKDYRKSEKYSDGFPPETAAIFGHALSLIEENNEAIKYYDKAIEFEPTQRLYFERGVAKSSINDAEGSLIDYTTAIAINAESELTWKSYANRGVIKAHRGDFLDAEKDLLAGLELNPNDHTAREWLARTYSGLKKYDQSYEQLTKILDLDPTYWEAYRLRGSLSLGRYQYELALPVSRNTRNYDKDEEVREQIEYIEEKLNTLVDPDNLLNPSENLEEWRNTQALLCVCCLYTEIRGSSRPWKQTKLARFSRNQKASFTEYLESKHLIQI